MLDKKHTPRHRVLALGRALALGLAAVASSAVTADERPSRLANPSPHSPMQSVMIENVNISTAEFWDAYTSTVVEERRRAELFLIGVLDATEGVSWCDYRNFKTDTINEEIYEGLKKLTREQMKGRAARTINQILAKGLPCGRKK
ncbi:Rap1a/Tai family immunity protein [Rhodoferax sp.]|uniref:Rap1a/Tai family immunity protein n=1 Tax=Rhodoferax sp. TaxID=50421 RepID=UPI00274A43D6|nr:Rap1a/Tai family immunity protein [Rhodoferax sp.]